MIAKEHPAVDARHARDGVAAWGWGDAGMRGWRGGAWGVALLGAALMFHGPARGAGLTRGTPAARLAAATHCVACHALPDPRHLDRATWTNELLPKMRVMVGLEPPTTDAGFRDIELLRSGKAFPEKPMMSREAFDLAGSWFVDNAPDRLASVQDPARIHVELPGFEVVALRQRHDPPLTTMARIDPVGRRVLLGDVGFQGYNVLGPGLDIREGNRLGNIPVAMERDGDDDWLACIGHFFPREEPRGQVLRMRRLPDGSYARSEVASGLPRLADLRLADLNGDGIRDFALCAYGNFVGRFSWWEGKGGDRWEEHVLLDKPGAVRVVPADFNQDGRTDLVVLVAQGTESLLVFEGDGRGGFTRRTLFQKPPSWGHSGLELADMNGDGWLDAIVCNGDNADFPTSPPRPHHGVRVYLNRSGTVLEEAWFGPMNGAYRVVARDFDLDGDMDLAATSFFPDYEGSPREGFLLFDNTGGRGRMEFRMATFRQSVAGRWLAMDAGDVDGDGDEDIVLGSLVRMPTAVPGTFKEQWEKQGPSLVLLRNRARPGN